MIIAQVARESCHLLFFKQQNQSTMKDKAKDNVIFRRSWWQCMKNLPSDARLALYDTICKYAFDGVVPEFDTMSAVSVSFSFIKQDIDSAKEKYQSICEKRAEAGKKHSGNQYTNGTNGTSVPKMEQNGTNGTDNDNDNDNDIKDKKRKNEKDKSFSFSQKKEKIIFDFSLVLLSEGRPNAYAEAREAYEYNDATGWTTETTKPNGDVTTKKITNPISWLKGWKRSNEQMFAPSEGYLYSKIFEGYSSIKRENECLIDAFRGIRQISDDGVELLFCNKKAIDIFQSIFENDKAFNTRVCATIRGRYPKAQNIFYKVV